MRPVLPLLALLLPACSSSFSEFSCRDVDAGTCVEVDPADDSADLLDVANTIGDDTTIVLGIGTFALDNQVTLRGDNITLRGQGMDNTVLDFGEMTAQGNGVDAIAEGFTIEGLEILDAPKDGLRIEDSNDVVIRAVRATWTNEDDENNGGYGLYPVRSNRVLLEDSEAYNASDAGIYVGQCVETVVRNNIASKNVAGLEIENTQYADVYGNEVTDNTGGLVVFDLPGNPVVGRDVYIHDNVVSGNNRANFAPGGVVSQIPAGTGTFALASRRVEITGNTYANNDTTDVAIISGLAIEGDVTKWTIPTGDVIGDIEGLQLDAAEGGVMNFRSSEIWVHDNDHSGSGTRPDGDMDERPIGFLLQVAYAGQDVDTVLYDTIGESSFDPESAEANSNDNHICVGVAENVTFASMDIETQASGIPSTNKMFRPEPPFTPFDCDGFREGDIVLPTFLD